eukprot:jgi/Hompol1/5400/HPOL_004386-RA
MSRASITSLSGNAPGAFAAGPVSPATPSNGVGSALPGPVLMDNFAVGFYIRVQLPTGDTTMLLAEETTSISEVIKGVESKKDITFDEWAVTVILPDGSKHETDPEQTLSNFKEIERLQIFGTVGKDLF